LRILLIRDCSLNFGFSSSDVNGNTQTPRLAQAVTSIWKLRDLSGARGFDNSMLMKLCNAGAIVLVGGI